MPQKVGDGFKFSFLNNAHTCGLKENGALFWGTSSQVGSETSDIEMAPVEIFNTGSEGKLDFSNICLKNWNASLIGTSCSNGLLDNCLVEGAYGCFGNLDNPSVVCVKMQHLIVVKMKIII